MAQIRLGPAGSPANSTFEGLSKVKELGLNAMEVQYSHGVGMGLPLAKRVGEERKRVGIELSVHAPYYINLASDEDEKVDASKKRILESCKRAHLMGAEQVVFHPAYYGKHEPDDTFSVVADAVKGMQKAIEKEGWNVRLAPETTGKHSAFGSLDETVRLVKETACSMCIDFAHLYARNNGQIDYARIFDTLKTLGTEHFHMHFSNINFGEKGERNHLVLDHQPDFRPLAKEIMDRDVDCTIISESPVTWKDSLKMKEIFEKMGHDFGSL